MNEEKASWLLPPQASNFAREVDLIYFGLLGISGAIILLLLVLIAYGLFKQQSDKRGIGRFLTARSRWIEAGWMVGPLLIFLGLFAWGADRYLNALEAPIDGHSVYVIGRQWMWQSYYPGGQMEQNTLHLPVGKTTRLVLSSEDVIHSFYAPAFRLKHDAVPGKSVQFAITPTQPGHYRLQCAEFCGTNHSVMAGTIVVMEPDAFAHWQRSNRADYSLAQQGAQLFRSHGCSGCHAASSTIHAPDLKGLYGSRVPLERGGFIEANIAYLRDSILLPGKHITAGYSNQMPSYQGQLSEAEIATLLAYLQQIGKDDGGE